MAYVSGSSSPFLDFLEWRRLSKICHDLSMVPAGKLVNMVVSPFDAPVFKESEVLVRAKVLVASDFSDACGQKVVLVLRAADWPAIQDACGPIKVLQAAHKPQQHEAILDCTGPDSAIVSTAAVVQGETLQVAEFFSGGFAGWSQASYIMHRQGVPLHVRWSIDVDPDCWEMQQCSDPCRSQVQSLRDLDLVPTEHQASFHICADVLWGWWVRVLGRFPVQALCVSSPCQPWSRAGGGSGLESTDGQLLLRVADLAAAFEVPVVLIEQVEHFPQHAHFPQVLQAWQQCGYKVCWCRHANLRDVLPCQRNRYLMALCRTGSVAKHTIDPGYWALVRTQSLAIADIPFALPPDIRAQCQLSQETMQQYMDPWLVPTPRRAGAKPPRPAQYRVKSPGDCAGVFVAQYQFQHELPPNMLETQGLHGCLFSAPDGLRFFSGPEIAAAHGTVAPLWLSCDARTQMRLLGNAIAVPHAAALLAQACRLLQIPAAPEMAQAVHWCLKHRIHNRNALLIPVKDAWVLCSCDQAPTVFAALHQNAPEQLTERAVPQAFNQVHICSRLGHTVTLQVPPGMPLQQLYATIGQAPSPELGQQTSVPWSTGGDALRLEVGEPLQLNCGGFIHGCGSQHGWCVVLTQRHCYIVDGASPRTWSQLLRVFDDMHDGPCELGAFSVFGQSLGTTNSFGSCIIASPQDDDIDLHSLSPLAAHVPSVRVSRCGNLLTLRGRPEASCDLLLGVPFHLLEALGWASCVSLDDTSLRGAFVVAMWPDPARAQMPVHLLHEQWRLWLLTALLEHTASRCPPDSGLLVEVQIVARTLWHGTLPATLRLDVLSQWWQSTSDACNLAPDHRVFSGPFPQEADADLQAIAALPGFKVIRKTGALLITVHPSFSGGGVKEENTLLAKTRTAALFLDRGIGLPETTVMVDSLVPKLGTAACLKALSTGDTASQWSSLQAAAKSVGVILPEGDNRAVRAAQRLQKAVRRRRLEKPAPVHASDFQLEEGSWIGIDHQPVPVLDTASHDCTGVLLLDAAEATAVDLDLLRNIESEALCVVIPGHQCPDPDSCDGRVSTAVTHRASGQHHLLAACYHNLGETSITPHVAHGSQVTVQGTTCCTFTMYRDDHSESAWRDIAKAPVRAANEAFIAKGVRQAINSPWARSFKADGRPSQPDLCDQCSFLAKVPDSQLKSVLQQSGFNQVFVVPRTWDRQLLPGWSVVWVPGSRADVEKQVSLLAEQHGLVRARNRFGVRVPTAAFDRVFRSLRPGQEVPATVQVKLLYKAGPFPASAAAADITEWARQLPWSVRVMKTLGPEFWLLGAETSPPSRTVHFNQTPLLLTQVQSRQVQQPVIQAGGPPPRPTTTTATANTGADPWLEQDPWSTYRAQKEGCHAGKTGKSATAPKSVDDQMALRVHTTESRLADLEQCVRELKEGQSAAALERDQDRQQAAQDIQTVRQEVQSLSTGLQQQLQQNLDSLRQAQHQQEKQMNAGMAELKSLMLACAEGNKQRRLDPDL